MADYAQAIDKIAELSRPAVVKADGEEYITSGYHRAVKPTEEYIALLNEQEIERMKLRHEQDLLALELKFNEQRPFTQISSLSSLCEMLKAEIEREPAALPYFVGVDEYNAINVYGSYEADFSRRHIYSAKADNKNFDFGTQPLEQAIITLQSRYENSGDIEYVIELCSRISKQAEVTTEDNGVTQRVQTNQGISLKKNENVRNRVLLSPFRTFMEVTQHASEHLLRLADGKSNGADTVMVSLIESDGGAWKLAAKANIAEYLKENLSELIDDGKVIVLQ
jgi:hypothetical protein